MVKTKRYMTQFSCIGPDCPDHCCGGWQITMSSAQAQKLYEVLPESQHQHITLFKDDMMCIDNSGKGSCLFLTEQRWCSVHRDYGEKKLPNICQNFPRKYSPIDHYTEMSGQLSCPEVTRLLLQDSDAFAAAEVGFHGEIQIKEHPQSLFWMIFPKLREIFQRVIQQSDQRMPATLIHVLQFAVVFVYVF